MISLELKQIDKRETLWERALLTFFLLFQLTATLLIFLHDSQGGLIFVAIITTFVKSVIIGAVTIELLRIVDVVYRKYWLNVTHDRVEDLELISH
jgi:hypothetical protein